MRPCKPGFDINDCHFHSSAQGLAPLGLAPAHSILKRHRDPAVIDHVEGSAGHLMMTSAVFWWASSTRYETVTLMVCDMQ